MIDSVNRPLKVFLCHASGDKPIVQKLYSRLTSDGVDAWLDKEKLIPGQNWKVEIPKAVKNSDVVIVCLSSQSLNKEGFVQKELKVALDVADEKPEGTIFIIPARLENCNLPERINQFHCVDLFSDDGYEWLLKALRLRANTIGAILKPFKEEQPFEAIPSLTIGKWYFILTDQTGKSQECSIIFKQGGTLIYQLNEINPKVSGIWSQNGVSIHIEVGNVSKWDGIIDGTKMKGTVLNNSGYSAIWNAIFKP